MKRVICGVAMAALAGCATPTYVPPEVTGAEIAAAAKRAEAKPLVKYDRTAEERRQLLDNVEERIRASAEKLCPEVADGECAFNVRLVEAEVPNAFVDGDGNVSITGSLLQYLENEDEVAMVMAHEFAHRMADHAAEGGQNVAIGSTIGAVILGSLFAVAGGGAVAIDAVRLGLNAGGGVGAVSYSKAQEREADYIGAYLVVVAGYDVEKAGHVMDRLAALQIQQDGPDHIGEDAFLSTHPSTPERMARMDRIVLEIDDKLALKAPLVPDRPDNGEDYEMVDCDLPLLGPVVTTRTKCSVNGGKALY